MAPNLAISQHEMIHDMILSKSLAIAQMAKVAGCCERLIRVIRAHQAARRPVRHRLLDFLQLVFIDQRLISAWGKGIFEEVGISGVRTDADIGGGKNQY